MARRLIGAAAVLLLAASACSLLPTSSSSAATTTRTEPVALDTEVAMPTGFPADFPIYPHARLTAAAPFASAGQTTWGVEWETTDGQARVEAFYVKQLNLGDWVLTNTSRPNGEFAATFTRKSDKNAHGVVAANRSAAVTKILVSLVASG